MFCTRLSMLVSATVVFLAIGPLQPNLGAAPGDDETARFDTYDSPDGETYFALSLKPNFQLPPSDAHDIVVLFDTSASQAGPYRDKALAALERLFARLRPNGAAPNRSVRVRLMAVDLDAVPMHKGLAAANDPQLDAAVAKLKKRVPLGSTDMLRALEGAIAGFDSPRGADRTIVYIGDGMSRASLIESQPFASLVGKLVSKRISVSSYAIGPQVDARLLAVLANHTGGNLAVDAEMAWPDPQQKIDAQQARIENERYAHKIGDFLATGATGAVLWPVAATWPKSLDEVYPTAVPPLRNDRASVVVGTGKLHGPMAVEMKADLHGKETELSWSARPQHSGEHDAYLAQLVKQARRDDGISLPTLGAAGLQEAARMASAEVNDLTKLARHAVVTGNTPNAELLAAEALRRDPGNVMAEAIRDSAGHLRTVSAQHSTRDLEMRQPAGHAKTPPEPQDGAALDGFVANRRVVAEMVEKEVRIELERARDRMSDDPEGVTQALKLQMERVRQVTELDPDTRARLTSELEAALRETDRRQIIYDEAQRERQERIAQAREQARLTDRLVRDQSLLRELIVRMGSLVDEGNYQTAEDVVGPEAAALDYYGATNVYHGSVSRAAILEARFEHWISRGRELTSARQRGVLAALDTVEASAIPQSDEPPVVYPPREFWLDITNRRKKWASVDLKKRGSAEEKISAALDETTKVDFLETPLSDAMLFLQDRHNIPIQLDQRGLDEAGLGSDTPISLNVSGISLKSALRLMLRPLDLTYTIQDEVLQITTRATIEDELTTRVYPVADLVLPIQVTGGGFGGGFGGGGIGGGGGFGGQGGGFGGQGGGFGGQGGGFGGGGQGFFTVNDEIHGQASPKTTDQELRLLKSDPKKPAATTAPPRDEAPLAKPRPAKSAEPIQPIAIDDRLPADVFWNKYFADDTRDEPAVRQAVRDLLAKRNFEHIIALCQAALRGGHAQPWMYETMALAMQAAGQSQNEVERALMSAADFAQTPSDLMYLAEYLSRIGLEVRALQVVREVAKLDPTNAAAYGYAFELGERLDDLDTQRWATRKVLSRSWPSRQRVLFDKAHRVALAIEARLNEEGRADEAAAFRADLDAALVRDCVVLVSWTGDADIDLMVEEPTGTVCSLRNPVTSGGGVMVGDPSVQYGSSSGSESKEIYTCAKGFPGAYRVMLRRVWGNVTAGKVTVDVYTNYRSGEARHERQQIPVGEKDAIVLFDVKQGRRTEPAEQQRVEQAANTQLAVSRSVLAQQLSSISDPRIADEIARRRGFVPDARLARGGAVGFQPVITVLPAGTTLSAFGVISADRRYVRVTPTPFFSAIGDVTTFTFAGGAAPVGGTGTGTGF